MTSLVPKVAAIHDMSCVGRCSLTVILPVLACMGIQACPLPTAVYSTHLGGFGQPAFADMTNHLSPFYQHWRQQQITFDGIYSGFLASTDQIETVLQCIDAFSNSQTLVLVDPVMGDGGKLYSVYTEKMQQHMRHLVRRADVITPNYTEACFLLEEQYQESGYDLPTLKQWAAALAGSGPSMVIITGIPQAGNTILNLGYDQKHKQYWKIASKYVPMSYPGTGDIFASIVTGALLQQSSLAVALERAAAFVEHAVRVTYEAGTAAREGVLLEKVLPTLCRL